MILLPIAPHQLHTWWRTVSGDLALCLPHDNDEVWLEDVYSMLRAGQATLYVALVDDAYAACVVVIARQDPWTGQSRLHIWLSRNHEGHDVLREGMKQLENIARQMGAREITLRSDTMAMQRLTRDMGFRLREIELVKEV